MTSTVADRLQEVRTRIAATGRDPGTVTIVAVTKGFGAEAVRAAVDGGLHDIGENYAQELVAKAHEIDAGPGAGEPAGPSTPALRWHFLGAIQRNKVRLVAPLVSVWQSVDRAAAGDEIARRAPGATVLVQVNLTGEAQRNGCTVQEAPALVAHLLEVGLDVRGLMGVGSVDEPRPGFRALAALATDLALPEISMGMTDDLEVAVEEGATMVRIGRALFGARPVAPRVRR